MSFPARFRNRLDSAHERQSGTKGEAGRVRRRSPKGYWRRFLLQIRQETRGLLPVLGAVWCCSVRWGRDHGTNSHTGLRRGLHHSVVDEANAFNTIYRHRFLPELAEIVPSVVPYGANLYAREPPKLLFALEGGGVEVIESARGVQQAVTWAPFATVLGS